MKAGTAWVEITPDRPLPLAGQMYQRIAERKRDPLTVNAAVFEQDGRRVALVSVDVCVVDLASVDRFAASCAAAHGLPAEALVVSATHTHVAPYPRSWIEQADPEFIQRLHDGVVEAVGRAIADLEPVRLHAGRGWLDQLGWNRRGMRRDGSCEMYWGSWQADFAGLEGPRDGEVGVIVARRPDDTPKLVVTSFATHPNCLENERFYSADLPGEVRRVLRGALGDGLGVIYLTGAAGDTAPRNLEARASRGQEWYGESGVRRAGMCLGGEILKVIAAAVEPMPEPVLRHERDTIDLPMREWTERPDLERISADMRRYYERSRDKWAQLRAEQDPVAARLSVLRLGDCAICFNPSELYVRFGLAIKARSPARVTLIGELTDGHIGYVPTPEAIRHGGYSAAAAEGSRHVPEAGWLIVDRTTDLLNRVFAPAEAGAQQGL